MAIAVLVQVETISGHQRQHILGVYSNPVKAWQAFQQRHAKNHAPYTGGIMKYNHSEMLTYALGETTNSSLLIYQHEQFQIYIQWNILDRALK